MLDIGQTASEQRYDAALNGLACFAVMLIGGRHRMSYRHYTHMLMSQSLVPRGVLELPDTS